MSPVRLTGALLLCAAVIQAQPFPVSANQPYGVLVSAPKLSTFSLESRLDITVTDPSGSRLVKALHAGDPDLYLTVRPARSGELVVDAPPGLSVSVRKLPESATFQFGSAFHSTWQTAEPIELGRTVYASADDRPYIPALSTPAATFQHMLAGIHWYKLDYKGPGDRLVHFNVDILDRDVPADVAVFTASGGQPVLYTRGRERYETEKSTNYHGLTKFAARLLSPGVYYVRVMANHPFYKLETDSYPAPPYLAPGAHTGDQLRIAAAKAVRAAMDYIIRRGDAWHANVPREGAVALRNSSNIQETRLCIGCHPTHFSTRGELFAAENGYPVRARSSLEFLIERLSNNPRPIYGKTDASWARMIHAPGNVLSRVSYLTDKYDRLFNAERRAELHRGITAYLEMYWPNMTEPSHESNGNLPRISGFEVALHNAMLFARDPRHKPVLDQIERLIVSGKTDDVLDICWKIDALVWLGRDKYAAQIAELRDLLFSHQHSGGRWAMPFGLEEIQYDFARQRKVVKKLQPRPGQEGPRASDFQTWHAIYALARAGVTLEDPRLRKAVELCLAQQTHSGAWQGNPDYKNFDTPFRDTQYALMALSTLFPNPSASPLIPTRAKSIHAMDQIWDRSDLSPSAFLREQLDSPHVLVRYQAAVTVGRILDDASIPKLAVLLGDSSKLVQRAAAWSLRQMASRGAAARPAAIGAIVSALDSAEERTRWGATRVFNQHFKYISEEPALLDRLRRIAAGDPIPANRMAAVQALYQWWFWDRDDTRKAAIEQTLLAALGRHEHPWVRRSLIEAYYAVLDDNVRYLYGSWIPRVKRAEDRKAIDEGHKALVLAQARRYLDAMKSANPLARDGLLRALYTHHIREGLPDVSALANLPLPATIEGHWVNGYKFSALYDPLSGGTAAFSRIGNDSEPPAFYADSTPLINQAFLTALEEASPQLVTSAMRALTHLRGLKIEPPLAHAILALLKTTPAPARADVAALVKQQLKQADFDQKLIDDLTTSGDPVALDVLAVLRQRPSPEPLTQRFLATQPEDRAFPPLAGMSPPLLGDSRVVKHVLSGLAAKRPQSQHSALRIALSHPSKFPSLDGFPQNHGPFALAGALSVTASLDHAAGSYPGAALPEIRRLILLGLNDPVHTIRAQALATLRSVERLHGDAEILARVSALRRDPEQAVRDSAASFDSSRLLLAGPRTGRPDDLLDYFYFKEHVEPLLITKASDGQACANCHANHTVLKLAEPDDFGVVTAAKSRANYSAVAALVNLADPAASLLLNKPIAPLDDEGIGDSVHFTHGGGIRWADRKNSPEYRTILRWVQGARL